MNCNPEPLPTDSVLPAGHAWHERGVPDQLQHQAPTDYSRFQSDQVWIALVWLEKLVQRVSL
ncbi:MAG: hypothetical protein BWZ02_00618 [Lentisphaerae bacterium ADurb.BinA184]|nr:MAG: hypothetical protein BWZ02_00618 [Lentisphaerae bacterium ADurb.BinA184]